MIKVKYDYMERKGRGIITFEYNGYLKEVYATTNESTCNRGIIELTTKAIQTLKEPCNVTLYLQCNIGKTFLSNEKKWVNRDLGDLLNEAIHEGEHLIEIVDCSKTSDGKVLQNNLSSKLINRIKNAIPPFVE